jgi:hypothetical protein
MPGARGIAHMDIHVVRMTGQEEEDCTASSSSAAAWHAACLAPACAPTVRILAGERQVGIAGLALRGRCARP